jgi:CRISPR-associated protein Csd1
MSLQDQGRFAVGYYHQRQDFFTKKENLNNKEGKE